ncbi:hypothetical protein CERZMDRAFT_36547 [Cercospora zeae-maydis SCOH1-5]|uniref:Uncharacterized protein n=1 Tax=Cercospora zeae-maydis SCOH1-5 TaxID=717836 RepID=A0A6A6FMR2_9PEZI|nr:hypothetical protein CERZMDRAFT_36547 [Cercospora zeae-maydis SCOH1-5]
MLFRYLAAFAAAVNVPSGLACSNCTNESPDPIEHVPAPWTLKGDIYGSFLLPTLGIPLFGANSASLPKKAFPPLERKHPESIAGEYTGRLGMFQVLRYTETPVGPYDELLIIPGFFSFENNGKREEMTRVSRIYVSQKYTAWNGRKNWNIPKHLARFDWTYGDDGSASVKVYPFDTTGDPAEAFPSEKPFFQMTFAPLLPQNLLSNTLTTFLPGLLNSGVNLNPTIPFTTDLYALLGINATLYQPPVPQGHDVFGAITSGGPYWKAVVPGQHSTNATLGLINMDQTGGDGQETGVNAVGDEWYPNFWPGLPKNNVALRLRNATITFSEATELPNIVA